MTDMDAAERAHSLTPRCTGGSLAHGGAIRWHSQKCEALAEQFREAHEKGRQAGLEEERERAAKSGARLERMIVLKEAELWCGEQSEAMGAVDGYDYRSGEEYAYRNAALYFGKAYRALKDKPEGGQ